MLTGLKVPSLDLCHVDVYFIEEHNANVGPHEIEF